MVLGAAGWRSRRPSPGTRKSSRPVRRSTCSCSAISGSSGRQRRRERDPPQPSSSSQQPRLQALRQRAAPGSGGRTIPRPDRPDQCLPPEMRLLLQQGPLRHGHGHGHDHPGDRRPEKPGRFLARADGRRAPAQPGHRPDRRRRRERLRRQALHDRGDADPGPRRRPPRRRALFGLREPRPLARGGTRQGAGDARRLP